MKKPCRISLTPDQFNVASTFADEGHRKPPPHTQRLHQARERSTGKGNVRYDVELEPEHAYELYNDLSALDEMASEYRRNDVKHARAVLDKLAKNCGESIDAVRERYSACPPCNAGPGMPDREKPCTCGRNFG